MGIISPLASAAQCALVLRDPNASAEEIEAALLWLENTRDSQEALEIVERFLTACDRIGGDAVTLAAFSEDSQSPARSVVMAVGAQVAAVAASLLLVLAGVMAIRTALPPPRAATPAETLTRYASQIGEVRTIALPDGSSVMLAGASAITVMFNGARRQVALTDGEAYFSVAQDRRRPFVVNAGVGATTAVGTAFNIQRTAKGATVTVAHGVVDVASGGHGGQGRIRLGPAMQVSYLRDGYMGQSRPIDLRTALSWRTGRLQFSNQSLVSVVSDLNRYSSKPITIDSDQIGAIVVTGMVDTGGIVEWLRGLAVVNEIDVEEGRSLIILKHRAHQPPARDL